MSLWDKVQEFAGITIRRRPKKDDKEKGSQAYKTSDFDLTIVGTGREYTPDDFVAFWSEAERGRTQKLHRFMDEMRVKWPHLDAELSKAEFMVMDGEWDCEAYPAEYRDEKDTSPEADRAREIANYVKAEFFKPSTKPLDVIRDVLRGEWKGVAGFEVVVTPGASLASPGRERLDAIVTIPADRFWYPDQKNELHFQPTEDPLFTVPVKDVADRIFVHVADASNPNPARRGLLRKVMSVYLVANFVLRWWAKRIERFGLPWVKVKLPVGSPDRTAVETQLANIGNAMTLIFDADEESDAEFLESSADGAAHDSLTTHCEREASKIVHGGTQTTDVQVAEGSKQTGQVQDDNAWMAAKMRALLAAQTIREGWIRGCVSRNFSPQDAERFCPVLTCSYDDPIDIVQFAQTVEILHAAGVDLALRWIYSGIGDTPADDEPILPGKAAPDPNANPFGNPDGNPPPSGQSVRLLEAFGVIASQKRAENEASKIAVAAKAGSEIVGPIRDALRKAAKGDKASLVQLARAIKQAQSKGFNTKKLEDALSSAYLAAGRAALKSKE